MGDVIDLEQIRRGRRLFAIFVQRFGVEWFLAVDSGWVPRLDPDRLDAALELAFGWMERRLERQVEDGTLRLLRRELRRTLLQALAERMVKAGF